MHVVLLILLLLLPAASSDDSLQCGADAAAGLSSYLVNALGGVSLKDINNLNPVLPPGVGVGYVNGTIPAVCLGGWNEFSCYKNQPMLHRILSTFSPNDYIREDNGDKDNNNNDEEAKRSKITIEDLSSGRVAPGEPLRCRFTREDERMWDAIMVTAEQDLEAGWMGIYYTDDSLKQWVPRHWCERRIGGNAEEILWSCGFGGGEEGADADASRCGYLVDYNNPLFHRAFKSLMKDKWLSSSNDKGRGKALFTYTEFHGIGEAGGSSSGSSPSEKEEKEKKYVEVVYTAIPRGMDVSEYHVIYKHLDWDECQQIDNKYKLFELYRDDEHASKVFPKSYGSYQEALDDTETATAETGEDDVIFYVKDRLGTRGEGIEIVTRSELRLAVESGKYRDNNNKDNNFVQRAVTDLYTIDGDGPIAGRRFDIRYFVLIARGRAFIHSNMWCKWGMGSRRYDPLDTDKRNQISKLAVYGGGDSARLIFPDVADADKWKAGGGSGRAKPRRRGLDPHGWRDAVADALDLASNAIFTPLMNLTAADPTRYLLLGGDAMIKEDGTAVIVEFNPWCDLMSKYDRLYDCLNGEGCRRMVMLLDEEGATCGGDGGGGGTDASSDNYHVTEHTPVTDILSSEALSAVLRDTASLVMEVQQPHEIELFREIGLR